MKRQQGFSTLLLTCVLLLLGSLGMLSAHRNSIVGIQTVAYEKDYQLAFAQAEEGLNWAKSEIERLGPVNNCNDYPTSLQPSGIAAGKYKVDINCVDELSRQGFTLTFHATGYGGLTNTQANIKRTFNGSTSPCSQQNDKSVFAVTGAFISSGSVSLTHENQFADCFPVGSNQFFGSAVPAPTQTPGWGDALLTLPVSVANPSIAHPKSPLDCTALQAAIVQAQTHTNAQAFWVIEGPVKITGSCAISTIGQPQQIAIKGNVQLVGNLSLNQANLLILGDFDQSRNSLSINGIGSGLDLGGAFKPHAQSWIDL